MEREPNDTSIRCSNCGRRHYIPKPTSKDMHCENCKNSFQVIRFEKIKEDGVNYVGCDIRHTFRLAPSNNLLNLDTKSVNVIMKPKTEVEDKGLKET